MGVLHVGTSRPVQARTGVTAADSAFPSGVAQAGSIAVPGTRGATVHVLVNASASGGAPTVLVTLFGYSKELNRWYVLLQLNGGAVIAPGTKTGQADGNNTHYAESIEHVGVWDRLYPLLTTVAGTSQSIAVDFLFEE